jgi:regulator of protease activity HflC (stomatin/prohibitin superfamily)
MKSFLAMGITIALFTVLGCSQQKTIIQTKMALYILIFLVIIMLLTSVKFLKNNERMVVFRLGRFVNIVGPALVLLIPILYKGVKVNLSEKIPGWKALSKEELEEKIKSIVMEENSLSH